MIFMSLGQVFIGSEAVLTCKPLEASGGTADVTVFVALFKVLRSLLGIFKSLEKRLDRIQAEQKISTLHCRGGKRLFERLISSPRPIKTNSGELAPPNTNTNLAWWANNLLEILGLVPALRHWSTHEA